MTLELNHRHHSARPTMGVSLLLAAIVCGLCAVPGCSNSSARRYRPVAVEDSQRADYGTTDRNTRNYDNRGEYNSPAYRQDSRNQLVGQSNRPLDQQQYQPSLRDQQYSNSAYQSSQQNAQRDYPAYQSANQQQQMTGSTYQTDIRDPRYARADQNSPYQNPRFANSNYQPQTRTANLQPDYTSYDAPGPRVTNVSISELATPTAPASTAQPTSSGFYNSPAGTVASVPNAPNQPGHYPQLNTATPTPQTQPMQYAAPMNTQAQSAQQFQQQPQPQPTWQQQHQPNQQMAAATPAADPPTVTPIRYDTNQAINAIEAFVAQNPGNTKAQLALRCLYAANGQDAKARELLTSLPASSQAHSRQLLDAMLLAAQAGSDVNRDNPEIANRALQAMNSLSEEIAGRADPTISRLALCSNVVDYGVYETISEAELATGEPRRVLVYCELKNQQSKLDNQGKHVTRLRAHFFLYDENYSVLNQRTRDVVDVPCANQRHDFFLRGDFDLPALAPGKYQVVVRIEDKVSGKIARDQRVEFEVAEPALNVSMQR